LRCSRSFGRRGSSRRPEIRANPGPHLRVSFPLRNSSRNSYARPRDSYLAGRGSFSASPALYFFSFRLPLPHGHPRSMKREGPYRRYGRRAGKSLYKAATSGINFHSRGSKHGGRLGWKSRNMIEEFPGRNDANQMNQMVSNPEGRK
jgi:hypothetical protein